MTNHLGRAMLVAAAFIAGVIPSHAAAQGAKPQSAIITLAESLKIPGKTLDPGAYTFEVAADSGSVTITRTKDNKVITTAKVMRADRPREFDGLAIIVARADSNDEFPTMKGFSYPGSGGTYQFVYSGSVAHELEHADETEIPIAPPQS